MDGIGPIEALVLVAVTVVTPLGLHLAAGEDRGTRPLVLARRLLPPAAALAVASFLVGRRGVVGAGLVLPWLLVTVLVGLHGAARLLRDRGRWAELAVDAGCAMLPMGGAWLVLSRYGVGLGFDEPVPLLTAIHFHYAAFATLVLAGMAGRATGDRAPFPAIVTGAAAGPPLLAVGITFSPAIKVVAALTVAASASALALLTLVRVVPRLRGAPRVLLAMSSLAVLGGMALAAVFAVGEFAGAPVLSLGQMARIHGPLNGLGFAVCGLTGWALGTRRA